MEFFLPKVSLKGNQSLVTVSYTHLDVYKRQPYVCNGCSQLSKCTLLKRIYDPADAHAVSYTHLDVYKRQVCDLLTNLSDIVHAVV